MFYLFNLYLTFKKQFKEIFYFIKFWLTVTFVACYVGFYYTRGWVFITYFTGVFSIAFISSWFGDFVYHLMKSIDKKIKRHKKTRTIK